MTRTVLRFLALLLLAGSSCTSEHLPPANTYTAASSTPSPTARPRFKEVVVAGSSKAIWEPRVVEKINERTDLAGIGQLRAGELEDGDIELRFWEGFGLRIYLKGLVLSRRRSDWKALRLDSEFKAGKWSHRTQKLKEPQNGWEQMWQDLLEQDLLTLPDARAIDCDTMVEDGFSYVVEIKKGKNYRTYMYDTPDGRCKESQSMIRIAKILEEEFDLP